MGSVPSPSILNLTHSLNNNASHDIYIWGTSLGPMLSPALHHLQDPEQCAWSLCPSQHWEGDGKQSKRGNVHSKLSRRTSAWFSIPRSLPDNKATEWIRRHHRMATSVSLHRSQPRQEKQHRCAVCRAPTGPLISHPSLLHDLVPYMQKLTPGHFPRSAQGSCY